MWNFSFQTLVAYFITFPLDINGHSTPTPKHTPLITLRYLHIGPQSLSTLLACKMATDFQAEKLEQL